MKLFFFLYVLIHMYTSIKMGALGCTMSRLGNNQVIRYYWNKIKNNWFYLFYKANKNLSLYILYLSGIKEKCYKLGLTKTHINLVLTVIRQINIKDSRIFEWVFCSPIIYLVVDHIFGSRGINNKLLSC